MNPVRSLGPAFVMNKWPKHWVFWLGPILGGLMASYFHQYILKRSGGIKKKKERRHVPTDGDSLDIPATELPVTAPDREFPFMLYYLKCNKNIPLRCIFKVRIFFFVNLWQYNS